jgi:hypothetical protein
MPGFPSLQVHFMFKNENVGYHDGWVVAVVKIVERFKIDSFDLY